MPRMNGQGPRWGGGPGSGWGMGPCGAGHYSAFGWGYGRRYRSPKNELSALMAEEQELTAELEAVKEEIKSFQQNK